MSNYDYEDEDDNNVDTSTDLIKQLRIDPTEESVSKWLESNADVFGIQVAENQTPNIDPAQAKQYQRMTNAAEQGNSPNAQEDVMNKLLNANSREELDAIIRQSGL